MEKTDFAAQSDMQTQIKAANGVIYVSRVQDVEPYLKANAAARNSVSDYKNKWSRKDRPMRHVAEIPDVIAEKWLREDGINLLRGNPDDMRRAKRKLDDPEYRYLKTHPGRIGVRRSQRF